MLDTNVLVSALISRDGNPGRILASIKQGNVTLITSEAQLGELRRVLDREHLRPLIPYGESQDLLHNLEAVGEIVADLPGVDASPDPDDNLILATAVAGRADVIVSGDKKHMLALEQIDGIPIVTAATAAARLQLRRR